MELYVIKECCGMVVTTLSQSCDHLVTTIPELVNWVHKILSHICNNVVTTYSSNNSEFSHDLFSMALHHSIFKGKELMHACTKSQCKAWFPLAPKKVPETCLRCL